MGLMSLIFAGATAYLHREAAGIVLNDFGYELQAIAVTAALQLDARDITAAAKSRDMKGLPYRRTRRKLADIQKATRMLKVQNLCLFQKTATPYKWEYLIDGDESDDTMALGDPFDTTNWPEMRAAYNGPTSDKSFRRDQYGEYLSGYAPVLDEAGDPVAVLEVYANASSVRRLQDNFTQKILVAMALALLACLPFSWLVGRLLASPISKLIHAAEAVGQGRLDTRVDIRSNDELGRLGEAFNQMTLGLKERDFVKDVFQKYVSKDVAQKIMTMPLDQVMAGERRRVTVLFTDVRHFTEMSEKMKPEDVLAVLNDHFSMLIEVLFDLEGTLDKFLGDGLMAIFGAPVTHSNDAERAVRAALRMQELVRDYNLKPQAAEHPALTIGIGIHTGTAVAGNIGSSRRKEYSVIGDTVNVAARLQSLAQSGEVVISGSTYEELKDLLKVEKLPPQTLKGKRGPIDVYRVLGFI